MIADKDFKVLNLSELKWPVTVQLPCRRFRLFVAAADTNDLSVSLMDEFAKAALAAGVVYFCA